MSNERVTPRIDVDKWCEWDANTLAAIQQAAGYEQFNKLDVSRAIKRLRKLSTQANSNPNKATLQGIVAESLTLTAYVLGACASGLGYRDVGELVVGKETQ